MEDVLEAMEVRQKLLHGCSEGEGDAYGRDKDEREKGNRKIIEGK